MFTRWLREKLCPFCFVRDHLFWHDSHLDARYYDDGFHCFCAQCLWCFSIYEHPEQSGRVLDAATEGE